MVLIAGILSIVFNSLINNAADALSFTAQMRYCANNANNFSANGLPLVFNNQLVMMQKGVIADQVIDGAYFMLPKAIDTAYPCVYTFDQDYQADGLYYGTDRSQDSTFYPAPKGGWFDPRYQTPPGDNSTSNNSSSQQLVFNAADQFGSSQLFGGGQIDSVQQFIYSYVFGSDVAGVGYNRKPSDPSSNSSAPGAGEKSGLLGNIANFLYKFNSTAYVTNNYFVESSNDPDLFMAAALLAQVEALEKSLLPLKPVDAALLQTLQNLTMKFPASSALIFKSLENLKVSVTLQAGSLSRLNSIEQFLKTAPLLNQNPLFLQAYRNYVVNPARGQRYLQQASQLSNALLASSSSPVRISHSLRAMPFKSKYRASFPFDIGAQLGLFCYPFALAFLFPTFVLTLVKEKEDRILIYLKMNGVSVFTYYLTHYVHFISLQILSSIVFMVAGGLLGLKLFTLTQPIVYIILLLLWANTIVAFSMLFSLLFNKSRFALMVSFFVVTLTAILSTFTQNIFNFGDLPLWWLILPFFSFYAGLQTMGDAAVSVYRNPYKLTDLNGGDTLATIFVILFLQGLLALLLLAYLNLVLPTEFGVQKPWYFIFTEPYHWIVSRVPKQTSDSPELIPLTAKKNGTQITRSEEELAMLEQQEDEDVKAERAKVLGLPLTAANFQQYPMIVKEVRKVYADGKVANKNICLTVDRNACFALLGPNGSGKTTLIHQLVGLYPTSSGTAYLAGYDVNTQQDEVHKVIGVCPQHDILYDDLTCKEHLLFYGRLKGIPIAIEQERAQSALKDVGLAAFTDKLSKTLSGGERRRLSLAIALLDDGTDSNGLVFLDEPTTGIDVEVRRVIWNIIQDARKKNKTIILTSHALDEVEILSTEVAIMSKGVLRCIGTTLDLKKKYGKGYKLQVTFRKDQQAGQVSKEEAAKVIESLLPEGYHKVNQGGVQGSLIYEFDEQQYDSDESAEKEGVISKLLTAMEDQKQVLGIEYGISQTSLEEVFLNIVNDEDAEAGAATQKKRWLC